MKRVCFFLTSLESGGAEQYLLRFIQFKSGTVEPIVICKGGKTGVLEDKYRQANAKIEVLPSGYLNILAWIRTYKIYRKYKPDAVCDFTGNFAGIFLLLAKRAGIKTRIAFYRRSSHAFRPSVFNTLYDKRVNKLVYRYATHIFANSVHGLNFFFKSVAKQDNRFMAIPNGINAGDFISTISQAEIRDELDIPKDVFVVGHTGRLNSAKNHKLIIKVAEVMVEHYPDIYFLFCGKDTHKLMEQTNSEKLKQRLVLLGYRTDVNRVLKALDLYVFPSITEGQPNALIEAMITGLPFVTSNIESIMEVIPEELSDLAIDPDDWQSFYNEIEKFYLDRQLAVKRECAEYATEQFNAEKNFNKLFEQL